MTLNLKFGDRRESYLEMQAAKTVINTPFAVNWEKQVFLYRLNCRKTSLAAIADF